MKKIASAIVLVVVVSVLAVTFAACNNATTQEQLVDAWKEGRPYQRYTYSVNDSAYDGVEGTYVSEIFYHAAYNAETAPEKVTVGDSTFEQREGYLIRSTLEATLDGKAHLIVTECYFSLTDGSSYLLPSATFRSESVDGNEVLRMNGTYSGNSLSYTLKTADGEKKGSIGLGSVFYDNNEFHQSLRGVSTFSTSFSFAFSTAVVNATEQTSASLTLSVSGTENISGLEFDSVGRNEEGAEIASETTSLECYKATLSRSTTVAGASQTLYYTVAPVYAAINEAGDDTLVFTYDNGWWALPHVLAAIVEPYNDADGNAQTVTYTLTDISLIRNATTQGQLVDAWKEGRPYERYTYSVNDSAYDGVEGTYVSEIFYHAAYNAETAPEKVTVGDSTFEQREGYLIRSTLEATLDGKAHLIVTECYFSLTDGSSYLLPSATFRSESVDGNEVLRMNGTYSGNSLSYTLKTADGEKKGSIGLGSVFYDNNEFHQSLRGVSTFSTSFSFAFSTAVVNATEQTSASLTLSVSGTENISGLEFDSVGRNEEGAEIASETTSLECYKATLSRSTTVAGASQTLYYTVAPVYAAINEAGDDTLVFTYDNGWWALPHVLAAIVEPYNDADGNAQTVTYTLTDISLIRPAE